MRQWFSCLLVIGISLASIGFYYFNHYRWRALEGPLDGLPYPHESLGNSWSASEDESGDENIDQSKFTAVRLQPVSTFSADVDTASYSNIREQLRRGQLPSADDVRVEEMLNYFQYDLPEPENSPFSVGTELSSCPWSTDHILRVAIRTEAIESKDMPPRNLVFLVDVSGSMNSPKKLPLLKRSLRTLVETLTDQDRVALVTYAAGSSVVLPPTACSEKRKIIQSIEGLKASGGTNGESGIQLAYALAQEHHAKGSIDRILLATDGDFNVGVSGIEGLKNLIAEKRESGLFLSVLGFGVHSNDRTMETLADHGNGNYASIHDITEARKVLVKEAGATLVTVAKDVKFQVAFNPDVVKGYQLLGYDNRRLRRQDFDDDNKDGGELGAGHSVTALYQLSGVTLGKASQLAQVRIRYKAPNSDHSQLMELPIRVPSEAPGAGTPDQRWATLVAGFGLILKRELTPKQLPVTRLVKLIEPIVKSHPDPYRVEFLAMVKNAAKHL